MIKCTNGNYIHTSYKVLPIGKMNVLKVDPTTCQHDNGFTGHICNDCGYECVDHDFSKGECVVCGFECEHEWEDGYCMICEQAMHEVGGSWDWEYND